MASPPRHVPTASAPKRPSAGPAEPEAVSFGGVMGALAVAIGLGVLGVHMLDLHGHQCDRCGRRWRHFGAFNLGDEKSHTCGGCGEVQWWKCGAPHVLRGSQFAQPPTMLASSPATVGLAGHARPALGTSALPAAFPAVFPAPIAEARALPSSGPSPAFAIQPRRRPW